MQHVALLVCTYRRPRLFAEFIATVDELIVPDDVTLHVAVADNNPESAWAAYIGPSLAKLHLPTSYGHETTRGYASARNGSLSLGLATPATVFLTTDDDQLLPPDWLTAHLDALDRHGADVVVGGVRGEPPAYAEGDIVARVSTRNVSFRRHLADPAGFGLTFDTSFDSTGHEDHDFFRRAAERGARIVWSNGPQVLDNDPALATNSAAWLAVAQNRAEVARASQRNKAARLRKDGRFLALGLNTLGSARDFGKGLLSYVAFFGLSTVRSARAPLKLARARQHVVKGLGRIEGLYKDEIARQDLRRNG